MSVQRSEILDYVTYTERRDALRAEAMAAKKLRRYHVGPHLTFLFENDLLVRYQVQEMMRVERIVKEADIQHELETYNEISGGAGQLGCTMMIEIDDIATRNVLLSGWLGLNDTLYLEMPDGTQVKPSFDARQVGDDRLSAVQYLVFDVKGAVPVAIGCDFDHELVNARLEFAPEQRAALEADLTED